jgi:predicted permease
MSTFDGLRRVFRVAGIRRDVKTDVEEELDFHFQMTIEELESQGMTSAAARTEAYRRFGDVRRYRKTLERTDRKKVNMDRLTESLFVFRQNVGYSLRGMGRSPGFTIAVIATLALGIGANATMFGIIDRLLLQPPAHVADAGQVRRLSAHGHWNSGEAFDFTYLSYPDFTDWQAAESFASVAAYSQDEWTIGRGDGAARVSVGLASGTFFQLLGVQPQLGRFYGPAEDQPGQSQVAVLSYGYWQRQFGGDASVLGRALDCGRGSYTVIGVAPEGFTGLELDAVDVWLPLEAFFVEAGSDNRRDRRTSYWLHIIARLNSGVDLAAAAAEATHLHRAGRAEVIDAGRYGRGDARIAVSPIQTARGPQASQESIVSRWLAGVSLVVLLIACANVANLLLARAARRKKEIAVRLALGISRRRLIGELLTDSVMLAMFGGAAALLIAWWGGEVVRTVLLPDVAWVDSPVDSRVLVFTTALALLTGLMAGLVPALQASRPSLTSELKEGAREGRARRSGTRLALLVAQGALSVVLLVGAGLVVRSLQRAESIDLGLVPDGVLVARLELKAGDPAREEVNRIHERGLERLRAMPAVERASVGGGIPFMWGSIADLYVPGFDSLPSVARPGPFIDAVWPDYFATMGSAVLRGRDFSEADYAGSMRVAVVNEAMARGLWGDEDPLGKCLQIGSDNAECTYVVGVVANRRHHNLLRQEWVYFIPLTQANDLWPVALFVRGTGDQNQLAAMVRRELMADDEAVRYAVVAPLQDIIDPKLRYFRLGATMFTVFGLLALLVAGLGLFSVLAFNIAQRTHEIGVRTALGASSGGIVKLVMRQALSLTAIGLAIGLAIAFVAAGTLQPVLYETSPRDPLVLIGVGLTLLLVSVVAAALPASRAARIDPIAALRSE